MQGYNPPPQKPSTKDGETTLKVSRIIHAEMISEFARFGFPMLGQYTDFILSNRHKIMEANTTTSPAQNQEPSLQNVGSNSDASPAWKAEYKPQPQGIYISNEDYYALKSNQEAFHKEREERGRLAHTVQALSNVIDALIEEAGAHSGSILANYNKQYFEKFALQLLKNEGVQL